MKTRLRTLHGIYYLFVVTNRERTVLEISTTGDLNGRICQLEYESGKNNPEVCSRLVYLEMFDDIEKAIERERDIKNWPRRKLLSIINEENPLWRSLNEEVNKLY